jgi:hypothetical protein
MTEHFKIHYSNNAIVSFYQLRDGTFIRHVNYTDCEKCNGEFKRQGNYASFNKCDCHYRFYTDNDPTRQLTDKKHEIKSRLKEIQKTLKSIKRQEFKEIKANNPTLNNRKRESTRIVNRIFEDKYINSDLAIEQRKLLKELWSLSLDDYHLDDWHTVDKTYAGAYNSQGYGSHKYTIGTLQPHKDSLDKLDIKSFIIDDGAYYKLISEDDIDLDDLKELNQMSLSDWCQYHWNRGRNPRVYNPFLPYDKPELEFGYNKTI